MIQERLEVTIPESNKWHNHDVEKIAKGYGMTKSEFVMEAVALLMKLDKSIIEGALLDSKESYLPLWYIVSEYLNGMAREAMEKEMCGTDAE